MGTVCQWTVYERVIKMAMPRVGPRGGAYPSKFYLVQLHPPHHPPPGRRL